MSLEMLRFGWQKLLVNQVPQKGGGRYYGPNYQAQWDQAQRAFDKAKTVVSEIQISSASIASNPATASSVIKANNDKANAAIAELDAIINQTNAIPEYIFEGGTIDKPRAISILNETRGNIARCLTTVPRPPEPLPVPEIPTIRIPLNEYVPKTPVILSGEGEWVPTGPIMGTGKFVPGVRTPEIIGQAIFVFAEDGNSYPTPSLVPLGLRYSSSAWKWQPSNVPPPPPPPPPKTPTEYELLSRELEAQLKQMNKIGRIFNKPIDPAPPQDIYPITSWQYQLWDRGYSLKEISWAENEAANRRLLETTNGDFALFKVKVEDLLQDAILSNKIIKAVEEEIVRFPVMGFDSNTGYATTYENFILGNLSSQPYQPVGSSPPPSEPPVPPRTCEVPIPYVDRDGRRLQPREIPAVFRRKRSFIPGLNKPVIETLPDIPEGICTTNPVPKPGNWEDCLIGIGASVSELDTVRRTMARSKLAPNADICNVAKNMLSSVRNQVAVAKGRPPTAVAYDNDGNLIAPQKPVLFGANTMNNIAGVTRCSVPAASVVKSNAIAQRKVQQARRGVLISRKK